MPSLPCLPYICGSSPVGIPSVSGIITDGLKAILKLFTGSAKDNLQSVLDAVTMVPVADLKADAFVQIYRSVEALVVILLIPGILINTILVTIRNKREESHFSAMLGAIKIAVIGLFLPAAVGAGISIGQYVVKLFLNAFSKVQWQQNITQNSSLGDVMSDLGVTIFGWLVKIQLLVEIVPIMWSVVLFTVLAMLAYVTSVIRNDVGSFSRWMWAALSTGLCLQPLMVITLTIGGSLIGTVPSEKGRVFCVVLLLMITLVEPFILFVFSNKKIKAYIENQARIKGDVRIEEEVKVSQQRQDQQASLNAQVANVSAQASGNPGSGDGGSVAGGALRAGKNAGVDALAKGGIAKVAESAVPGGVVLALGATYVHHKYMQKRDQPD